MSNGISVLSDWHHPTLYESYLLTMQDRLGYDVYKVIGMEYFDENIWKFEKAWAGDKYAHRFLDLQDTDILVGDHYERRSSEYPDRVHKMLTLEQARELRPEFVLSSVSANHESFDDFAKSIKAQHIIQIGNNEHFFPARVNPVILDATNHFVPDYVTHVVKYSPEFDTKNLFYHSPVPVDGPVASFILVWTDRAKLFGLFNAVASELWDERPFYVYGEEGQVLETEKLVAERMQETAIVWQTKSVGDGYGFVIHGAAAIGRPIFGFKKFYHGARAEYLWDASNSVNLFNETPSLVVDEMRKLLMYPEKMQRMGEASYQLFKSHVNFEEDAENIRKALEARVR